MRAAILAASVLLVSMSVVPLGAAEPALTVNCGIPAPRAVVAVEASKGVGGLIQPIAYACYDEDESLGNSEVVFTFRIVRSDGEQKLSVKQWSPVPGHFTEVDPGGPFLFDCLPGQSFTASMTVETPDGFSVTDSHLVSTCSDTPAAEEPSCDLFGSLREEFVLGLDCTAPAPVV